MAFMHTPPRPSLAFTAGHPRRAHADEFLPSDRQPDPTLPLQPSSRHGKLQGRLCFALGIIIAVHVPDIVAGQRKRQVAAAP